jgi:hypothetical protein
MSLYDERMRILREVQEGKLSKPEATRLLQNLALIQPSDPGTNQMPAAVRNSPGLMNPRMLRVRKRYLQSGETIYELLFQASLIEAAKRIGAHFSPSLDKLTHKELQELLLTHVPGILFEEEDQANQTCTESFLF